MAQPSEPHAIARARERYGIALTRLDLYDLARRCAFGEGLMGTQEKGTRHHALIVGARLLWVVWHPERDAIRFPHGVVLTIMPPEVGNARGRRDYEHMKRRKGVHADRRRKF